MSSLSDVIHGDLEAYGVTDPVSMKMLVSVHYDPEQAVAAALSHWKERGKVFSPRTKKRILEAKPRPLPHLRGVTEGRPGVKEL